MITNPQEPSWESNVYFIVTIRIFVLMGTAYLIRSLYILLSVTWGSRLASAFACKLCFCSYISADTFIWLTSRSFPVATMSILGLEEIELDTLPTAPEALDIAPDLEAHLTASVQLPPRSYDPGEHMQTSHASPRAHGQRMGTPVSSIAANAIPEQDIGVRHGTTHIEENNRLTVELSG